MKLENFLPNTWHGRSTLVCRGTAVEKHCSKKHFYRCTFYLKNIQSARKIILLSKFFSEQVKIAILFLLIKTKKFFFTALIYYYLLETGLPLSA